jgi:hypothetical protein
VIGTVDGLSRFLKAKHDRSSGVPTEDLRGMKAGTDRREFRKLHPSKSRKGGCGRPVERGRCEADTLCWQNIAS